MSCFLAENSLVGLKLKQDHKAAWTGNHGKVRRFSKRMMYSYNKQQVVEQQQASSSKEDSQEMLSVAHQTQDMFLNEQISSSPPPKTSETISSQEAAECGYTPGTYDVLSGRGRTSLNHVGNRRFRATVRLYLDEYLAATSRLEKTEVVMKVVHAVHQTGGRFLKRDPATGKWVAIGEKRARERVGHALRDAHAERIRSGKVEGDNSKMGDLKTENESEPLPIESFQEGWEFAEDLERLFADTGRATSSEQDAAPSDSSFGGEVAQV